MKIFLFKLYGFFIMMLVVAHFWTVYIAFSESGFFAALFSFLLPFLAEIYWTIKMIGVNNVYAVTVLVLMVIAVPVMKLVRNLKPEG